MSRCSASTKPALLGLMKTRTYLYQPAKQVWIELCPETERQNLYRLLTDQFVVCAPRGTPAVSEDWRALRVTERRDASASNRYGLGKRHLHTIASGTKRQCYDAAFNAIMDDLDRHIGRCVVCNLLPMPRRKIVEVADGWTHRACYREAEKGTRWLKGLDAPTRALPENQRSLLQVQEGAGECRS